VNRELHFLNVGLLARLQISEREIGDLQNSGPIPRGSFKFELRRVLRLRLAGVELRRKEELPVFVGRVHVPCVRPGISYISEMPALDIDRIGSCRGPGEIARVMMLALAVSIVQPYCIGSGLKTKPPNDCENLLPFSGDAAEHAGSGSTTRCRIAREEASAG
jgi:hypothetical protein